MLFFISLLCLSSSKLLAVLEVCRHGARAPTKFQRWDDVSRWPEGPGSLTPAGMRQHYLLGTELRRRYVIQEGLLSKQYNPAEIYVFSSDIERCLQSVQSQLQGLYPLGTGYALRSEDTRKRSVPPIKVDDLYKEIQELGNSSLPALAQLLPIHDDENIRQKLLRPRDGCAYYDYLTDYKMSKASKLQEIFDKYPDVVEAIKKTLNCSKEVAQQKTRSVIDSIVSNKFEKYPIPELFKNQTLLKRGEKLAALVKGYEQFEPDLLARLAGTSIFNRIVSDFTAVIRSQTKKKMFIYSGHDTTLSYMLAFLQLDFSFMPPFASTLLFELHETRNDYYITLRYNDVLQNFTYCNDQGCSFDKFMEFVAKRAIPHYDEVCRLTVKNADWINMQMGDTNLRISDMMAFGEPELDGENETQIYSLIGIFSVFTLAGIAMAIRKKIRKESLKESLIQVKN